MPNGSPARITVEAVSARVDGLGAQFNAFADRTEAQFGKLFGILEGDRTERMKATRVDWIALITCGIGAVGCSSVLIGGYMSLRFAPVDDSIVALKTIVTEQKAIIDRLDMRVTERFDKFVARSELNAQFDAINKSIATEADKAAVRSAENKERVGQVRERAMIMEKKFADGDMVTAKEFAAFRTDVDREMQRQDDAAKANLKEVKDKLEAMYPASHVFNRLEGRLDRLEEKERR